MASVSRRHEFAWPVALVAAGLFALPFAALLVQAFGDEWRYPALLPQRLGLRGIESAVAAGAAGAAFENSAAVAVATTALALLLGWPAARVLGERRLRRPGLLVLLLALPLLVPGYASGTGLTAWFIRLGLTDSFAGLVLAHLTVVLPYVVLVLAPGFRPSLRELEEMARSAGAGPAAPLRQRPGVARHDRSRRPARLPRLLEPVRPLALGRWRPADAADRDAPLRS